MTEINSKAILDKLAQQHNFTYNVIDLSGQWQIDVDKDGRQFSVGPKRLLHEAVLEVSKRVK